MQKEFTLAGIILVAFVIILFVLTKAEEQTQGTMGKKNTATQQQGSTASPTQAAASGEAKLEIDETKKYTAVIQTTAGEITVEFNARQTPITVNNFVTLARKGFYDGTPFHRTIKGFMIQGGDPTGTGRGGPGYQFDDEPFEGEYTRGTIAMANAGPDTNGSQFFIMHADYDLPPNYTIFGRVVSGIETVDKIAEAPTKPEGEGSTPVNPVKIESIEIIEE